jgi:hypothetical protein
MKPLPLPIRVAAGLVATAAEKARQLPKTVTGLPITVASQALQLSMRVQQQVTEMAIRGDSVLAVLRPVEETPEWATFDEDAVEGYLEAAKNRVNGLSAWDYTDDEDHAPEDHAPEDNAPEDNAPEEEAPADDPWAREERAVAAKQDENQQTDVPPQACPTYPDMSIAQLRGMLRSFTVDELRELLEYERAHENRDEFTSMLSRRIDTVRAKQ